MKLAERDVALLLGLDVCVLAVLTVLTHNLALALITCAVAILNLILHLRRRPPR